MEAQSDPLFRTNGPPAGLFPLLFNQVPMDGEMLKNETRIKHESLDREIGDENPMSLRRLPHAVESDEKKTPAQPIRLDQRTIPHEISPVSTQGFLTECALRDFIHEGLAQFCLGAPRSDATVEYQRTQLVNRWHSMPVSDHQTYKTRASMFINTNGEKFQSSVNLDRFTMEDAGFYTFVFSQKADNDHSSNLFTSDNALCRKMIDWSALTEMSRQTWIEAGVRLRHKATTTPVPLPTIATCPGKSSTDRFEPQAAQQLCLQEMFANSTPEILAAAMEKGAQLLEGLKKPLIRAQFDDACQWLQSIENTQKLAVQPKTIVGVVGNTGAGKSSVINAMFDQERLVPTNCMRACTAVVTEISYNHGDDPYRAEIEFISRQDWEKELKVLFQDLLDNGKISHHATNEESEAGVAYAKIKAVYPKYTREMLQHVSADQLMSHESVQNVLGGKREIIESDCLLFYKRLQFFVDSKEKNTGTKDKEKKLRKEMEFWPLIKVVRLYVKSAALSTGAVIVDLPGVHDSNAARSAIAEGYMKQCTGLWIVAPITRAVDDKAAKSLLGESFKRQVKMDGGFNTVTFICSKTDDISLTECQESLGLEEEMSVLHAKSDEHAKELRNIEQQLSELKDRKAGYEIVADQIEEQLEIWEGLKQDIDDGKMVFAPPDLSHSRKRKRGSNEAWPRKKTQTADTNHNELDDEEDYELQTRGDPLTKAEIDVKYSELKGLKKDWRRRKVDVETIRKDLREQKSEIDAAEERIQAAIYAMAISGRNEYSRGAIQQDFAAVIKELDQEVAEENDAANFDPDIEARDYDEVARSLPVFCVSSRGYQKLSGRLEKEPVVPGFQTIQETEIPQLRAHCEKLTVASREESSRRFLNSLSQLLNSLRLWLYPDDDGVRFTDSEKARLAEVIQNRLKELDTELEKHVKSVCQQVRAEFKDNIFNGFENAISKAEKRANKTVLRWGAPVNRDNRAAGGYAWSTYNALCRRSGLFSNAQGRHDWNAELIAPITKTISSGWEKSFSRRIPMLLNGVASSAASSIKSFHDDIEARIGENSRAVGHLQMLSPQLSNYQELLKDLCRTNSTAVTTQAKDINRMFQPVIAKALEAAYGACVEESGPGRFMRMKQVMTNHVNRTRRTMFHESTNVVKQDLEDMIKEVEKNMLAKKDEVSSSVKRDYSSALFGKPSRLSGEQSVTRDEILEIVSGSKAIFTRLIGSEPEVAEPKLEPADDNALGTSNDRKPVISPAHGGGH